MSATKKKGIASRNVLYRQHVFFRQVRGTSIYFLKSLQFSFRVKFDHSLNARLVVHINYESSATILGDLFTLHLETWRARKEILQLKSACQAAIS